jgi:hypothetical protein
MLIDLFAGAQRLPYRLLSLTRMAVIGGRVVANARRNRLAGQQKDCSGECKCLHHFLTCKIHFRTSNEQA